MTAGGEGAAAPAPDQAAAAAAGGPPGRVESTEFVPMGGDARFDPAVLSRVECALADSLGPVARILVRKAAKTARDVPALCQQLDVALPEAQRAEFRRRLGDVAGPARPAPPASKTSPGRPAVGGAGPGSALVVRGARRGGGPPGHSHRAGGQAAREAGREAGEQHAGPLRAAGGAHRRPAEPAALRRRHRGALGALAPPARRRRAPAGPRQWAV